MEERTKSTPNLPNRAWVELQQKTKDDPEPANQITAAERMIQKYGEALQRLANF